VPRAFVIGSFATLVLLAPRIARADEPSAADVASARKLGFEGITLADKGNCAAAVDKLARAEKLYHAPTTLGRLGECQVQLGKVVEGTENLGRTAREELGAGAPQAFVTARARARKALAAAMPKLAHAKISVKAPPDANVTVTIDNATLPSANVGEDRALDPGPHLAEASAPGYVTASVPFTLREGGSDAVTLTLTVDPNAKVATASSATTPDTKPPAPEPKAAEGAPNRTAAYVVLGVGVVGVGLGSVFGLSALSQKNDLAKACPNSSCTTKQQSDLDSAKRAGTISTVAFGVGAAALVVGGVLFFTAPRSQTTAAAPAKASPRPRFAAHPYFDVTSAGFVGSF
jgi:hypothetical protein